MAGTGSGVFFGDPTGDICIELVFMLSLVLGPNGFFVAPPMAEPELRTLLMSAGGFFTPSSDETRCCC